MFYKISNYLYNPLSGPGGNRYLIPEYERLYITYTIIKYIGRWNTLLCYKYDYHKC